MEKRDIEVLNLVALAALQNGLIKDFSFAIEVNNALARLEQLNNSTNNTKQQHETSN